MANSIRSTTGTLRIATIVVGILVLGIGLYSHFQSAWVKSLIKIIGIGDLKPYQFCELKTKDEKCPHIALERFYVTVIVSCFIVSLFGLLLSLAMDMSNKCIKIFDVLYHIAACIALLAAAAGYIYSAEKINGLVEIIDGSKLNFRRTEKLIAGGLTIFQGILYGITAIVAARS